MKTRSQTFILLFLFLSLCAMGSKEKLQKPETSTDVVTINTSPELFNLVTRLSALYQKSDTHIIVHINQMPGLDSGNIHFENGQLHVITEGQMSEFDGLSTWSATIGRDIIVPVMNAKNPFAFEIAQKGISLKTLSSVINSEKSWGQVLNSTQREPIHLYVENDQSVISAFSETTASPSGLIIHPVERDELVRKLQSDPLALGFCKLVQVTASNGETLLPGIQLVPIDRNGNGKIDYIENIYNNLQSFNRGVWIGKYPHELSSAIYIVSNQKPQSKAETNFLKWILTSGQQVLPENGLFALGYTERLGQLTKVDTPEIYAQLPEEHVNTLLTVLLLSLILIVLGGVLVEVIFRLFAKKGRTATPEMVALVAFNEDSVNVPKGLYFDKSHSWAFRRKDGSVKVGIDDFMQHVTGRITKVELKEAGMTIRKGDPMISVSRKGKLLKIYSPVTGTILEVNEKLRTNAALLNSTPYSDGWVYVIEPVNWELELQYLQIAEKFKANLQNEFRRLKEFFHSVLKSDMPDVAYAVMQDGGSFVDHPLADMSPDVWDDFQTQFIDASL